MQIKRIVLIQPYRCTKIYPRKPKPNSIVNSFKYTNNYISRLIASPKSNQVRQNPIKGTENPLHFSKHLRICCEFYTNPKIVFKTKKSANPSAVGVSELCLLLQIPQIHTNPYSTKYCSSLILPLPPILPVA